MKRGQRKLTQEKADAIREEMASGAKAREVAAKYGVSLTSVYSIANGVHWAKDGAGTHRRQKVRSDGSVKINEETGCWESHMAPLLTGYAVIRVGGKLYRAHRLSWALTHGFYPDDSIDIHHTCGNKKCFNPDHLEAQDWLEHRTEHVLAVHRERRTANA